MLSHSKSSYFLLPFLILFARCFVLRRKLQKEFLSKPAKAEATLPCPQRETRGAKSALTKFPLWLPCYGLLIAVF
jgi:hypothetical protein